MGLFAKLREVKRVNLGRFDRDRIALSERSRKSTESCEVKTTRMEGQTGKLISIDFKG